MVLGIKEPDEDEGGEIDNRVFGNLFHRSAQLAYLRFAPKEDVQIEQDKIRILHPLRIHQADLEALLADEVAINRIVDQAFREELFKLKDEHARIEYNGLQIINREVIIGYLRRLLEIDKRLAPFSIKALEQDVYATIDFTASGRQQKLKIGGYIDRLDEVSTADAGLCIRVIDYKTGNVPKSPVNDVPEIFGTSDIATKHTDYFLQTILYSIIVHRSGEWNGEGLPVSPALLFIQHSLGDDYDPVLKLAKEKITDVAQLYDEFKEQLQGVLGELFEPEIPFRPTDHTERCASCPYNRMCGI